MNEIKLGLPDGTVLRAVACPDSDFPAINLYWTKRSVSPSTIPNRALATTFVSVSINLIRTTQHITSHIWRKGMLYEKQQSNQN